MKKSDLQRYIEGVSTQQEKERIAQWLDDDPRNMTQFNHLRRLFDISVWNQYRDAHRIGTRKIPKSKRIIREIAKIAAVFLLGFCIHYFFIAVDGRPGETALAAESIYVPEGQRSEVVLSDGTKVWLNANSILTFPALFSDTARMVELHGEAYFDVAHHPERRFVVKTRDYHVRVLGTEFNVIAYPERQIFETALIRGSVEIAHPASDHRITLTPDHRVSLDERGVLAASRIVNHSQFLWKEGIMAFEDEPVVSIFEKMERFYGVTITVLNDSVLKGHYTGKFWTNDGVEQVLKVLQLRQGFAYTIDGMNRITIR